MSKRTVDEISRLMCEMDPTGATSDLSGGTLAQDAVSMTINQMPVGDEEAEYEESECSEEELKLAKKFVELVGDPERARELVDKVADCEDCLGIIGDEENIDMMADIMPDMPDMPTSGSMAVQFDPNSM